MRIPIEGKKSFYADSDLHFCIFFSQENINKQYSSLLCTEISYDQRKKRDHLTVEHSCWINTMIRMANIVPQTNIYVEQMSESMFEVRLYAESIIERIVPFHRYSDLLKDERRLLVLVLRWDWVWRRYRRSQPSDHDGIGWGHERLIERANNRIKIDHISETNRRHDRTGSIPDHHWWDDEDVRKIRSELSLANVMEWSLADVREIIRWTRFWNSRNARSTAGCWQWCIVGYWYLIEWYSSSSWSSLLGVWHEFLIDWH